MILYWMPLSSYSASIRIACALKRLMPELRLPPDGSYRSAAYRAIVPLGTVPALVDGEFVLSESATIVEYLDERFPQPSLLPGTARERARARYLVRFHDLHLEPHVRALFAQLAPATRDTGLVAARSDEIARKLDLLEDALDRRGPYAIGADPSIVDCAFPATLAIIDAVLPELGQVPVFGSRTKAWREFLGADERIESVMRSYRKTLATWITAKLAG